MRKITLVTKPGCHLCDAARDIVIQVVDGEGAVWEEVNMLEHPELAEKYAEMIPVTLIDGQQHDYWRVDPERLRKALRAS